MELFEIFEPTANETPVLVEVPHAGTWVPSTYLASVVAPVRALGRDADLYVDELYEGAPAVGATLIVARTSRYILDLNRAEDDWDAAAVEPPPGSPPPRSTGTMPRGLVWRLTTEGDPALARPLSKPELDERVARIHRPYHEAVRRILERKRARFGHALLLAGHSMPSTSLVPARGRGRGEPRADVVPGTQGRTTAAAPFIDCVERHAAAAGYSVRHDEPYKGGFATRHYGRPSTGVHAVQVELARRLYMNEATLQRSEGFSATQALCRGLAQALGAVRI